MDREGLVQDVAVQLDGQTYQASYFVENGTINAQLQDQTYLLPLGGEAAAQVVKSLLLEKVRREVNTASHPGFRYTTVYTAFSRLGF